MEQTPSLERQLAELSLLYSFGKSFSAELDLSELLKQVVEAAAALMRAECSILLLPDPETEALTVQATYGLETEAVQNLHRFTYDDLVRSVLERGEALLFGGEANQDPNDLLPYPVHSLLCIPLSTKGRVIGVLGVQHTTQPIHFTPHDQAMLTALGGYAAIAIENARLFEETVQRTRELSMLVEAANAISSSLDLDSVLRAVAHQMMRGLSAHWCLISGWDREMERLHVLAEYREAFWEHGGGLCLSLADYPYRQRLLTTGEPFAAYLALEESGSTERQRLVSRAGQRMMGLPLQAAGEVIGMAEVVSLQDCRLFTLEQINRSTQVAQELALLLREPSQNSEWRRHLTQTAHALLEPAEADWCVLYIWDSDTDGLCQIMECGSGVWLDELEDSLSEVPSRTLSRVLQEQCAVTLRSTDDGLDPADRPLFEHVERGVCLVLPLTFHVKTIGLVRLYDVNPERVFSAREIELARALTNQAAAALENARLFRDLERSLAEQKMMQAQLVHTARLSALGELAAAVTHQINNPLTIILGDAEILAQDIALDDPGRASVEAILGAGRRAKAVVERLLNMAWRDDKRKEIDINQTIEGMLAWVDAHIARADIELDVQLEPDLPLVEVIPGQLEDVWLNLLTNARDAMMPDRAGHVWIRSRQTDDRHFVEVSIQDNGCGIAPNDLDQIFDPFFTTKPRGEGTGLGLYICHLIVAQHNGTISVTSEPGQGTQVVVQFPVAEAAL